MHLTGRAWVTCHDLAAREAGKGPVGILSAYSGKWPPHPPRLSRRAFQKLDGPRHCQAVMCPQQAGIPGKGTNLSKAQKARVVLAPEQ